MKKIFLFLLCFLISIPIWSSELNRVYMGWTNDIKYSFPADFSFKGNTYSIYYENANQQERFNIPNEKIRTDKFYEGSYTEEGTYTLNQVTGISFLYFQSSDSFQLLNQAGLLFYGPVFYLCLGNQIFFETGDIDKGKTFSTYAEIKNITTSSFLTEKDTVYDGKTFSYYNKNLIPWVENVPGEGIGEWIEVTLDNKLDYYEVNNLDTILISNGYVNFDKPLLYSANNRVKKIQITCPENGMDFEAELEDTAQFQAIKLPEPLPQKKKVTVRFTIKEVYKGTRWNDTCINRILIANSEFLEK